MSIRAVPALVALACALASAPAVAQGGKVEVLWLGQSAFRITSPGGKVIVTDPFLIRNPTTPAQYKALGALGKVDVLLVSHGHFDHIADAPALATLNEIPLWGPGDLNATLQNLGVLPAAQLPRFNKSGRVAPAPGISVTATRAEHSSVYVWRNPVSDKDETHPGGEPVGTTWDSEVPSSSRSSSAGSCTSSRPARTTGLLSAIRMRVSGRSPPVMGSSSLAGLSWRCDTGPRDCSVFGVKLYNNVACGRSLLRDIP